MSYILEALKKAQAERQLGSAPTIHAVPVVPAVTPGAAAGRKPLLLGLGAGVVIAGAAIFAWRQQPAAPLPVQAPVAAEAPVPAPVPASTSAPAPAASAGAIAILPAESAPAARIASPGPVRKPVPAPASVPARVQAPEPAAEKVREAVAAPSPAAPVSAPVAPLSAPIAAEDNVGPLSALPAAIQGQVPRVSFGGYIYSPNPADRLLLVDKALRHEGEEVAPGLVLEKLLPKAAVMNYKGYRYRVAY